MRGRIGGRDGEPVRTRGLHIFQAQLGGRHGHLARPVEALQLGQRHPLDIAPDAALAEAQRHPGLEVADHPGLHLRMGGQVVVQPVGPAVHQRLQEGRARRISGLQVGRIDEQFLAQIRPDRGFALRLGGAAQRGQVVGLHPVEVVLGLGIDHPEHGLCVGLAVHMGDAPVVADDGHRLGFLAQAGEIAALVCSPAQGRRRDRGGQDEGEGKFPHVNAPPARWSATPRRDATEPHPGRQGGANPDPSPR